MDDVRDQDDVRFDRLVDGELSAGERRALLESLDSRPDGWRRCAVAFLEAQSWSSDLREMVHGCAGSVDTRKTAAPSRDVTAATAMPAVVNRANMRTALSWAAIAASLLVAFSLGMLRRSDRSPVANQPIASAPVDSVPPDEVVEAPPLPERSPADPDVLTLWARDETGRPRSIRVPLMDASALDRELGVAFQPGMPADVRARLQNDGYHVQSKRRYAPLWLENGQRMVLPVEDTKIVPVSQNVY